MDSDTVAPTIASDRTITIRYFASVREGIGVADEKAHPPVSVDTVGRLIDWLRGQGPHYAAALAPELRIRAAVDQMHAKPETPISGAREIALFPMMTGG